MSYTRESAEVAANDILTFVNSYCHNDDAFAETVAKGHKTLQQSVMRLFIATIRKMADVTSDDRNAETVELTKKIVEIADDYSLPFI